MERSDPVDANVFLRLESARGGEDLDVGWGEGVGRWEDEAGVVNTYKHESCH